jgi:hypothetical protein
MLFGGGLAWKGWVPTAFTLSLMGLSILAFRAFVNGCQPVLLKPFLLLGLAAIISLLVNRDILFQSLGWISVLFFGFCALLAGANIGEQRLLQGLYWAGWIWLILWPLPRAWGWIDNRNLLCVWPMIFVLVILAKGKPWWWAIPHVVVLFALGSRGAILGLSVGLLVWKRPRLTWGQAALFATVGFGVLWALTIFRAQEAFNRFAYWAQALDSLVDHNIWLGLGPGGIAARRAVLEPGSLPGPGSFHQHAHNFIVQWTAETGLVGLTALLISFFWILKARIHWRWQLPILAAILVHCLVDFPLYFPGPLLVFMAIAGSEYRRLTSATPNRISSPPNKAFKAGISPSQTQAMKIAATGIKYKKLPAFEAGRRDST